MYRGRVTRKCGESMSCISPLIAFPSKLSDNGKVQYIPRKVSDKEFDYWFNKHADDIWSKDQALSKPILVPCGKCIGCRLDYSREWAARCMLELKYHDSAYFLTLTYSDQEAPRVFYTDPDTGEALTALSLRKRDFTLFMKNLRRHFPNDQLRFYMCGEYGSDTFRPHYHAIIFGLHLDDLEVYKRTETGLLYNSEKVNRCWIRVDENGNKFRRGFVVIGEVNWETCAYVARYTAKKSMTVGDEFWSEFNLEKPFVNMSRRPGIGLSAMYNDFEFFNSSELYFTKGDKLAKVSIPRYFYRKLEEENPELAEELRQKRKLRGNVYTFSVLQHSRTEYSKIVADQRENLIARSKLLKSREI